MSNPTSNCASDELRSLERLLMEYVAPLQKRFGDVGIQLTPAADADIVRADALLDPDQMLATITHFAAIVGTDDLRIGGTHWLGQYGYALLPPIEMAMARAGIGLDASLSNLMIVLRDEKPAQVLLHDISQTVVYQPRVPSLDDAQIIRKAGITSDVTTAAELRHFVLERLVARNLRPLVHLIHDLTGVSLQVLWGQIAYEADLFFQQLVRVDPNHRTDAWEEDRAAFFVNPGWSVDTGPNPLVDPTRTVQTIDPDTGSPKTSIVRSTCCLIYKVPNSRMCGACPLAIKRTTVIDKLAATPQRRAALRSSD